ncbi:AzlC family ABC transporter permease [Georgenia thermotolerans]|uniref:Branched-chain amino acid ABC transporter permease n=1 Tax=Georgenia thermotolerans TaxID=527326 RepID=A0A7J5UMS4_9MICO|nr:AzlC family ABC transporter permease [Georgenia thermotolerans]KAE8763686.1 branched-chain amino acid ABC transporter permease [Georgenia thermotolerans]
MPAAPSAAARPDRRHEVALAARDTVGVGMGYLPLGAAFGVLLATSGLAWWWAPVFSVLIYAGSMEFLAIGLVTGGVGLAQVAATTFFVNFRHVFYGLSFPLLKIRSALGRLYGVHALTDEAYALLATKPQQGLTGTRVLATQVICHLYWLTGSTAGALLGARLGLDAEGLGFALTALFVVLTIDAFRAAPDLPTLLVALACAALALVVAPGSMLVIALTAFVLVLIARFALGTRRRAAPAATGEHHLATAPAEPGTRPVRDGGARPREDQDA